MRPFSFWLLFCSIQFQRNVYMRLNDHSGPCPCPFVHPLPDVYVLNFHWLFFLRFIPEVGFDCLMDQLRFVCHSHSLKKRGHCRWKYYKFHLPLFPNQQMRSFPTFLSISLFTFQFINEYWSHQTFWRHILCCFGHMLFRTEQHFRFPENRNFWLFYLIKTIPTFYS